LVNIPYATQWIDEEDVKVVAEALKSDWLTQGPKVKEFEEKVAAYCGTKYAVALNSGTSALHAACFAAAIGKGDEVITSPITFVATANCVLYCGGKPVFADVCPDTINIDPEEISEKITARTKAIIPVHFAGNPSAMEEINKIAKENDLVVIEDACHALGAEYKGSKIGSCKYSDMTVLSFHAVKHITTGEGGVVLTNEKTYYDKLLLFRSHGITKENDLLLKNDEGAWYYEMQTIGFNYRLTDFQSALGINQLAKLDGFVKRRREIAKRYDEAFADLDKVVALLEKEGNKSSYHLYVIQVEDRRRVFDKLRGAGVLVNVHYIPVYWQPYYQKMGYRRGECPKAEAYYAQAITLSLYPKMADEDVLRVIDSVKEALKQD